MSVALLHFLFLFYVLWHPDIQHSIDASSTAFGNTELKSMTLHWDEEVTYNISNTFDVIVACDLLVMFLLTFCFNYLCCMSYLPIFLSQESLNLDQ
jgi:hypothetical protein